MLWADRGDGHRSVVGGCSPGGCGFAALDAASCRPTTQPALAGPQAGVEALAQAYVVTAGCNTRQRCQRGARNTSSPAALLQTYEIPPQSEKHRAHEIYDEMYVAYLIPYSTATFQAYSTV